MKEYASNQNSRFCVVGFRGFGGCGLQEVYGFMSGGDDFASPAAVAVQPLEHLELQTVSNAKGLQAHRWYLPSGPKKP